MSSIHEQSISTFASVVCSSFPQSLIVFWVQVFSLLRFIPGYFILFDVDSLIAQMVKNLPAMQDTQVRSLGREDSLEKGMATHSSFLFRRIPCKESDTTERLTLWLSFYPFWCEGRWDCILNFSFIVCC